jgi:hypothetical protein
VCRIGRQSVYEKGYDGVMAVLKNAPRPVGQPLLLPCCFPTFLFEYQVVVKNDQFAQTGSGQRNAIVKRALTRFRPSWQVEITFGIPSETSAAAAAAAAAPATAKSKADGTLTLADMPSGLSKLEALKWRKANLPPADGAGGAGGAAAVSEGTPPEPEVWKRLLCATLH